MAIKTNTLTKKIAYTAMFVAIAFLINYLYIPFGDLFSASLVPTILFTSAFCLDPLLAFLVGAISDLLGCFAKGYAPNIFILIGSSLWGLIMGLCYNHLKVKHAFRIIIGAVIGFIFSSCLFNSYGLYTYTSKGIPFIKYLLTRAPIQALNLSINVFLSILVELALRKRKLI